MQFYWLSEVCIQIEKEDNQWQLSNNKYMTGEGYGCGYKPNDGNPFEIYEFPINNVEVWEQLYLDIKRPAKNFFPMQNPSLKF